jgi:Flp pilus assembly protein TadB
MDIKIIIGIVALLLALTSIGVFLYSLLVPRQSAQLRNLMGSNKSGGTGMGAPSEMRQRIREDETGEEFQRLKEDAKRSISKKEKVTLEERLFQAGMYSDEEKKSFQRLRIITPIITTGVALGFGFYLGFELGLLAGVMGILLGLQLPISILDRRIKRHHEDIMYYLPLVIEQVVIGVSSSLDIGPCLSRIVSMADERDSHNSVTILIRYAQSHIKSGVSMEEALTEIGKRTGHTELKHAFMALAQVAKHGGEITRQLQELADAVSSQREARIEEKIKKLELEATMPVALVFVGFLLIILIGFGIQVMGAFK